MTVSFQTRGENFLTMDTEAIIKKILIWMKDEASKELPDGYIFIIGGEMEKAEREIAVVERFLMRKYAHSYSFLLRIGWIRSYITNRTIKKARAFFNDMIGECLLEEEDGVDAVLLYPDRVLQFYNDYIKEGDEVNIEELENISREFAKHECRHASQFVELRKLGVDPSVVLAWEFNEFEYGEGPLETDAFLYQLNETDKTVSEVCREIRENLLL